jgi:hypothetical protein
VTLFIPILLDYLLTALAVWALIGPFTAHLIWWSRVHHFCWLLKEKCCGERLDVGQMMEGLCDTFCIPCVACMRWPSTPHVMALTGVQGMSFVAWRVWVHECADEGHVSVDSRIVSYLSPF